MALKEDKNVYRLYIAKLSREITVEDLKARFSRFGIISDLILTLRDTYDTQNFAHLTLVCSASELAKCQTAYSGTNWAGEKIKVAIAKPNFMRRLVEERAEIEAQRVNSESNAFNKKIKKKKWFRSVIIKNKYPLCAKDVVNFKNWKLSRTGVPVTLFKTRIPSRRFKLVIIDSTKYPGKHKRFKVTFDDTPQPSTKNPHSGRPIVISNPKMKNDVPDANNKSKLNNKSTQIGRRSTPNVTKSNIRRTCINKKHINNTKTDTFRKEKENIGHHSQVDDIDLHNLEYFFDKDKILTNAFVMNDGTNHPSSREQNFDIDFQVDINMLSDDISIENKMTPVAQNLSTSSKKKTTIFFPKKSPTSSKITPSLGDSPINVQCGNSEDNNNASMPHDVELANLNESVSHIDIPEIKFESNEIISHDIDCETDIILNINEEHSDNNREEIFYTDKKFNEKAKRERLLNTKNRTSVLKSEPAIKNSSVKINNSLDNLKPTTETLEKKGTTYKINVDPRELFGLDGMNSSNSKSIFTFNFTYDDTEVSTDKNDNGLSVVPNELNTINAITPQKEQIGTLSPKCLEDNIIFNFGHDTEVSVKSIKDNYDDKNGQIRDNCQIKNIHQVVTSKESTTNNDYNSEASTVDMFFFHVNNTSLSTKSRYDPNYTFKRDEKTSVSCLENQLKKERPRLTLAYKRRSVSAKKGRLLYK